ncbi:MAG: ribbon-helix-helix protein, CopG family [Leptolyngbya sp. UWPOB_LEPTO1]|uniref:ribbon-helix-helix protein, CopG family n=1 Tax=Leptolyngbya sp. UWPOB_LEPTO1 TaxID=2815653 RepID=UPI001AC128FF|nr:ribbon-helix-helix protein, CopG family [Leptolyngbya sp. UWPOB_LEPTO1]MBN8563449.1 ribbon-helix-helix protein, CopG family [Leptolyngbya sp. UWPOB_LEPTO1]
MASKIPPVPFRCVEGFRDRIDAAARKQGKPRNQIIRVALERYLAELEAQDSKKAA